MTLNRAWPGAAALLVVLIASVALVSPHASQAQTPASLDDETMLSLVLPPLADGSRPGVHLWARADQARGPGGLPTVFVVTLYTKYASAGPEEHEIVNYLQYSNGGWAPARPRDDGTLLVDDWAWISLNLTNLTAVAGGQGDGSQYTVDYTASGTYAGAPRQLTVEEVYAADLSPVSAAVISDTNVPTAAPATLGAAPTATPRPAGTAAAPNSVAVTPPRTATPTIIIPAPSTSVPAAPSLVGASPAASATPGTSGSIIPGTAPR